MPTKFATIDEYISSFPIETQEILAQIRTAIKEVVPNAEETISYAIPTFKLNGSYLVYFAAFKNHIGFYATPTGHEEFKSELSKYREQLMEPFLKDEKMAENAQAMGELFRSALRKIESPFISTLFARTDFVSI